MWHAKVQVVVGGQGVEQLMSVERQPGGWPNSTARRAGRGVRGAHPAPVVALVGRAAVDVELATQ